MRAFAAIAILTYCTACVLAVAPVRPGSGSNPSPRLPRTSASQFPKNSTSRSSTTKPTFRTRWVSESFFFFCAYSSKLFLSCFEAFLLSWHYATLMHGASEKLLVFFRAFTFSISSSSLRWSTTLLAGAHTIFFFVFIIHFESSTTTDSRYQFNSIVCGWMKNRSTKPDQELPSTESEKKCTAKKKVKGNRLSRRQTIFPIQKN